MEAPSRVQQEISAVCREVEQLLLAKNREYGNSALEPLRVFSSASTSEQINVRIDDKLSRIQTMQGIVDGSIREDTELDLIGYLILKRVFHRVGARDATSQPVQTDRRQSAGVPILPSVATADHDPYADPPKPGQASGQM